MQQVVLYMVPTYTHSSNVGKFLLFSDLHYDRFYATALAANEHDVYTKGCNESNAPIFSKYYCDSSRELVESFVVNAAYACPEPDFIIFTGDATRHDIFKENPSETVYDAYDFLYKVLRKSFPNTPLASLPPIDLGNNDFDENYHEDVSSLKPCLVGANGSLPLSTSSWLSNMANYFRSRYFISDVEAAVFSCGGEDEVEVGVGMSASFSFVVSFLILHCYFAAFCLGYLSREVIDGLHIIVLNSVLWSTNLRTSTYSDVSIEEGNVDPFGQHMWLIEELTNLRGAGKKAYITGHTPLIVDVGIAETHLSRYYDTISRFPDVVAGQMFGHLHSNSLFVSNKVDDELPPIIVIGSISPSNGNDPTFSVVSYDRGETKFPVDLTSYTLPLDEDIFFLESNVAQFRPLFTSLLEFFGMEALTNVEVSNLAGRLVTGNSDLRVKYWHEWNGLPDHSNCSGDVNCLIAKSCTIACGSSKDLYEHCNQHKALGFDSMSCSLPLFAYEVAGDPPIQKTSQNMLVYLDLLVSFLKLLIVVAIFIHVMRTIPD